MIPIIYETDETAFVSNGLGRLRDCISCIVTEERNGIYECDFEYPVDGANYDLIQIGRIIGVTHDESDDVQPFDIVGFEKPIDGIVTFHCVHISYRQTRMTVTGSNINSLADAFTLFGNAQPSNPFNYNTDKTSTGYMASANGIPHTVREMLGGVEGSVLDAYGGEYEWDKWTVNLWASRGEERDFSIRYGVNMLSYDDEYDAQDSYSSCIPYWTDGTNTVIGSRQDSGSTTPTGREECVPLDVSQNFEAQPSQADVESAGLSYMNSNHTFNPQQTLKVSFLRLQDMSEYTGLSNLLQCKLCDTINVVFPDYGSSGQFKIVKTVWNVLESRYDEMELGDLSVTLAQALGVSSSSYVGSGGGGGGTSNYNDLDNKPQINGVTLSGNKNTSQLSIHDLPSGGSTGQVLAKNSGTNYDVGWTTPTGQGTSVPTADEVAEFDASAKMNSTDMSSQDVSDFVDGLNVSGGELIKVKDYSYSYSNLTGSTSLTITASQLGFDTPTGYVPIGVVTVESGHAAVELERVSAYLDNRIRNVSSSNQSGTYALRVAYAKA